MPRPRLGDCAAPSGARPAPRNERIYTLAAVVGRAHDIASLHSGRLHL